MPDVNGIPFPYTPQGKKAAAKASGKQTTKNTTKKQVSTKMGMKRFKGGL